MGRYFVKRLILVIPTLFLVSIMGIIISAIIIYYFSGYMEFDKFFEKKYSHKIVRIRKKLNSKYGFLFIIFCCFFPLFPSDLICYVAGTIKINFKRYILAVFLGESVIVSFYIFSGNQIITLF